MHNRECDSDRQPLTTLKPFFSSSNSKCECEKNRKQTTNNKSMLSSSSLTESSATTQNVLHSATQSWKLNMFGSVRGERKKFSSDRRTQANEMRLGGKNATHKTLPATAGEQKALETIWIHIHCKPRESRKTATAQQRTLSECLTQHSSQSITDY